MVGKDNYLQARAAAIRAATPNAKVPDGDTDALFLSYAALSYAKGGDVTPRDVHDAWTAWKTTVDPSHEALVPYDDLPAEVAAQDEVFASAIKGAVGDDFASRLFPNGLPPEDRSELLELFKVMVETSEKLVARRLAVNTFYLTAAGVLLTALGWMVGTEGPSLTKQLALALIGGTGVVFSISWRSSLQSFGQLNTGKFKVINRIERELAAAPFDAEWCALGEGKDPKIYRSFTSREVWVPQAFTFVYAVMAVVGLAWLVYDMCA